MDEDIIPEVKAKWIWFHTSSRKQAKGKMKIKSEKKKMSEVAFTVVYMQHESCVFLMCKTSHLQAADDTCLH